MNFAHIFTDLAFDGHLQMNQSKSRYGSGKAFKSKTRKYFKVTDGFRSNFHKTCLWLQSTDDLNFGIDPYPGPDPGRPLRSKGLAKVCALRVLS